MTWLRRAAGPRPGSAFPGRWLAGARLALLLAGAVGAAGPSGSSAQETRSRGLPSARLEGDGVQVLFDSRDSLRAEAVLAAFLAQPPLPALSSSVPTGVTVVLAPDEAAFRRAAGGRPPEWSAAVALPALDRIVLPPGASERGRGQPLWRTLRHEWAHLGLRQSLPGLRVPRWFDEGYAQWAAGWDRTQAWRLRLLVAAGRTPPLDSLTLTWPRGRASAESAYLLAATAVEYLVEASGERGLEVFIRVWRDEGGFEVALRRVYGVTTGQFEEDWRAWVRRRYGWLYVLTHSALVWAALAIVAMILLRIRRRRDREHMARLRASEPPERPAYWLDDQHQDETLEETVDEESTT
jgi:hypothetical protein